MPEACVTTVRREFTRIKHLPPLSPTASQLLEVVADPEVDVDCLAKIICQDPGLSARILGLANSAYFGQARAINTVREAIIRVLGLNMVKSLALSIAVAGIFDTSACKGFDLSAYWHTALGTAMLSRLLAERITSSQRPDVDSVYLCGLLHNLGTLFLAHALPEPLSKVLAELEKQPDQNLRALEVEYLDTDHLQAGEWLARRWHLPEPVVEVIGCFDDTDYIGQYPAHVCVVSSASGWVMAQMRHQEDSLSEYICLGDLPGLEEAALATVEEKFRVQAEHLHTVTQMLF